MLERKGVRRLVHATPIGFLTLAGAGPAVAQNLVPNAGFEEVLACPDFQSQLDHTTHWFDPSEGGTPDYYHACGDPWYAVPQNTVGFQEPVDGVAYAGIFLWIEDVLVDWREYLEVGLTVPLVPGQCYRFRMHANLGDFSGFTTDRLGVHFATDSILSADPFPPGMSPHIALAPGTFLDRTDWITLEGEYEAGGGERFLMIGNYYDNAGTTTQAVPGGPPNTGDFVYCYVDSVSLTPCGAIALDVSEAPPSFIQGAMPFTDVLHLRLPSGLEDFIVRDSTGRVLVSGRAVDVVLDSSQWPSGCYQVELKGSHGAYRTRVLKL